MVQPGYGETWVHPEELDAMVPDAHDLLGDPVTKAAVYDLEQGLQMIAVQRLLPQVLARDIPLRDLLSEWFVRDLHAELYGDLWQWAGRYRLRDTNIGIAPALIGMEMKGALDTILWRFEHTDDLTPRDLGIAVHCEVVRIHPFVDGNGRATRLLADLVYASAQEGDALRQFDWAIDKPEYIRLLQEYDQHRNIADLAAFIPVREVD